jgi:hypothetical protein
VSWETSFVAMSAALGVEADVALSLLAPQTDPEAKRLTAAMKSANKVHRAQAMAAALAPVAREIAAADLEADA